MTSISMQSALSYVKCVNVILDEALKEHEPPLQRQIITPIKITQVCSSLTIYALMNVKPWWRKGHPELLDHYLHVDHDVLQILLSCFAYLLI